MPRIEWGNRFCTCHLITECERVQGVAEDVFGPWKASLVERPFGPWRITASDGGWEVCRPPEMASLSEFFDLPNEFATPELAVKAVEFQAVGASISLQGAPLGFHGALLERGGVGLALVGIKEAGKSTLSAALASSGWQLLTDDAFQLEETELRAFPVARRARLRAGSREHLPESIWTELSTRKGSMVQEDGGVLYHPSFCPDGVLLTHLVLLSSEPGKLRELEESELMLRSVVHSHTYHCEGLPSSLAKIASLSNRVRGFEMGRMPLQDQARVLRSLS